MGKPTVSKIEFDDVPSPIEAEELAEDQAQAIRRLRAALAKKKAIVGPSGGPMNISSHLDAERMLRLGLLTPEQIVDLEDRGFLPPAVLKAAGIDQESE